MIARTCNLRPELIAKLLDRWLSCPVARSMYWYLLAEMVMHPTALAAHCRACKVRPAHLRTIALQPAASPKRKHGWRSGRKSLRTGRTQTVVMLTQFPVAHGYNDRLLTQCVSCAPQRRMWQDAESGPGPAEHNTTCIDCTNVCNNTPTTSLRTDRTLAKQQRLRTEAPHGIAHILVVVWCLSVRASTTML